MREEIHASSSLPPTTPHQNNTCNCSHSQITDIEEVYMKANNNTYNQKTDNFSIMRRSNSYTNNRYNTTTTSRSYNNEISDKRDTYNNTVYYNLRRSTSSLNSNNNISSSSSSSSFALCTCQQSRSFPYCDNSHKQFNKETNSSMAPILVSLFEDNKTRDNNNPDCIKCGLQLRVSSSSDPFTKKKRSSSTNSNYKKRDNNVDVSGVVLEDNNSVVDSDKTLYRVKSSSSLQTNVSPPPCTYDSTSASSSSSSLPLSPVSPLTSPSPSPLPPLSNHPMPSSPTQPLKYIPSSIKDPANRLNVISANEVAEHCTRDSLWMIIKENVYDITEYVPHHPGGVRALMNFAGKDGTENVQFHSNKMLEILNSRYFIGKLYVEKGTQRGCIIS